MRKGFIFNKDLCVNCKACMAACMIENGWESGVRRIYTHNSEAFSDDPVVSFSMACNHCSNPLCLKGCPVAAYSTDELTEAILIDPEKCIGCLYCIWNCPYDAPKLNPSSGIIEKCHFCYHLIRAGEFPACCTACPTGALGFGEIPEKISFAEIGMLPEKMMNPSYLVTGEIPGNGPEIIPSMERKEERTIATDRWSSSYPDSSLVVFSFLSAISVASAISAIFSGRSVGLSYGLITLFIAAFSSIFHLRSKLKAWRSAGNLLFSPLSREIAAMIIYGILLLTRQLIKSHIVNIVVALSGIVYLLLIDNVYHFTAGKGSPFRSGEVFLTALLMISFFTLKTLPFIFIAAIKFTLILFQGKMSGDDFPMFGVRFLRIASLFISIMVLVSGTGAGTIPVILVFLTGEFLDRFLFYYDFEPLTIKDTINKPFNIFQDEK